VAQASNAGGSSPDSMPSVPVTAGVCGVVPSELIDVDASAYFARAASCLLDRRITTNNPYKPAEFVTRAQMAAFLWRLAGEPASDSSCGFIDEDAIPVFAREGACWLKANGITTNNPYKPGEIVNRAQMAGFLYRAGGLAGLWLTAPT
jgi:hypothetical protein